MISLEDRQSIAGLVVQAHRKGARLKTACEVAGIDTRTLQRWKSCAGLQNGDARPRAVRPVPAHALSPEERERILQVANEPRFAALPPARIVPMLADEGVYIASESSFSRVLRAHGQTRHRGRAKAPRRVRPPTTHVATGPRQVWTWDMSFLPTKVLGVWCYLYLILDIYSRKIVGYEVHESDDSDHAVNLLRRTALAEGVHALAQKPVLHGDNGSTLKATTVLAMIYWLGLKASYSRPRVSDDNAFVESLFRTAKYRPEFPAKGFADLEEARQWASSFVHLVQPQSPPQRHPLRQPLTTSRRHGPRHPGGSTRSVCPRESGSPAALGASHAKLESDHRRHAQSRARLCDHRVRERRW